MKRIILMLVLLFSYSAAFAQTESFREFSGKYSGRDGYTMIEMSGEMFKAMGNNLSVQQVGENGEAADLSRVVSQMKNMVIIVSEDRSETFGQDVTEMVNSGKYKLLATINEGTQTSRFYSISKGGKTVEFLMTVFGGDDNVIMSITGDNLDVSQITRMK